ncbi:MAG: HEPN domain-containing protein [Candidatus Bathyarchaeia archaeon]
MSGDIERREAVNWYEGAIVDLDEAEAALSGDRPNWALFASHQAVEKALKAAYLTLKRERPPRTHDLVELHRNLGVKLSECLLEALSELTPYYSVSRYPNAGLEKPWLGISKSLAKRLVEASKRIVEEVGIHANLRG